MARYKATLSAAGRAKSSYTRCVFMIKFGMFNDMAERCQPNPGISRKAIVRFCLSIILCSINNGDHPEQAESGTDGNGGDNMKPSLPRLCFVQKSLILEVR